MANSIDMDKYLNGMIGHDYVISDVSWFNMHMEYTDTDTLSDDFIKELSAYSGLVTLDVHKDSIETVDKFLEDYCEKRNVNMQYKSRELYKEEYQSFKRKVPRTLRTFRFMR